MDFWIQHSIWFILGLLLWPRMLLIYFGLIPTMSVPPILGMLMVPRMFLAGILTPMYWETNPILISICWILAVICDVCGLIMKLPVQIAMFKSWKE